MKEEIARKWIEELRSGRHDQARGAMKDATGAMCCLGVLEIVVLGDLTKGQYGGVLTREACDMAGIKNTDASVYAGYSDYEPRLRLPYLNDEGTGFPEIADIIEKNWPDL